MLAELTIALPLRFVKELIRRWFSGKETPNSLVICNVRAFVTSQTGFYVHEPSHISGRVAPGDLCQRGMALPLIQARKIAYRGYIHPRADPGWDRGRQLINKMNLRPKIHSHTAYHFGKLIELRVRIGCSVDRYDQRHSAADQFIDGRVVKMSSVTQIPTLLARTFEPSQPFR